MPQQGLLDSSAVYRVTNPATGQVISARVRVADTLWARAKGLLGRVEMAPDEGLLITRCDSVHTFFMKFPIDLLYLDRDFRVVKMVLEMEPSRMSFCLGKSSQVLELRGGVTKNQTRLIGTVLKFEKQA